MAQYKTSSTSCATCRKYEQILGRGESDAGFIVEIIARGCGAVLLLAGRREYKVISLPLLLAFLQTTTIVFSPSLREAKSVYRRVSVISRLLGVLDGSQCITMTAPWLHEMVRREVLEKPSDRNSLVVESWSQGLLVGSLIILSFVTVANMRKGVLLHKASFDLIQKRGLY